MSKPEEVIPDELVLAAIDRAERHDRHKRPSAFRHSIMEHLDIPSRSGRARRVRVRLEALVQAGVLERCRPQGIEAWRFTPSGRQRLRDAYAAGTVPMLPESPQHREWRDGRVLAGQEVERSRRGLRDALADAEGLLDAHEYVHSDAWFEAAERLQHACKLLGWATHCLHEWPEPDDERADIDDHSDPGDEKLSEDECAMRRYRRHGRRNVTRWDISAEARR